MGGGDSIKKLTKKQKKALDFRTKKSKKSTDIEDGDEVPINHEGHIIDTTNDQLQKKEKFKETKDGLGEVLPKKRKTRRGKKGKGLAAQSGGGPRFILFIGNLPYDVTNDELMKHFQKSKPDRIRLRAEKGIAFMEFYSTNDDIRKKIDIALAMHHSLLRNRKINVELTVGGGGNSENRLEKIKLKNEKLLIERRNKIITEENKKRDKKEKNQETGNGEETSKEQITLGSNNVHPSRAKFIK
ncbi:hypothetical protein PACTADRAFT_36648 [Pachysolen tannophilus NRRL Y-2460]|uniref:RRM domain-containing protein n=1 Tax=Pachysolen tannophilus NRRL Y-2460 TaxID=669874 RepID=A0A1E4U2K7_PACTA|nr:hypothetical protein PACTADRAFT_36648 [Pachysolen tannophilus NRRL Y-2460]